MTELMVFNDAGRFLPAIELTKRQAVAGERQDMSLSVD